MKNGLLYFLLGVFLTISIAATTISPTVVTSIPATPKQTITETFTTSRNYDGAVLFTKVKQYIDRQKAEGFIVKSVVIYDNNAMVVIEKY